MKNEKKNTARRAKFNIIDLLIVIAVFCVAAAVIHVYFSDLSFGGKKEKTTVTYSLRFSGIDESFISAIAEGEAVVDSDGYAFGTVVSADLFETHKEITYDSENRKVVSVPYPSLCDLTVIIRVNAESDPDRGYTVSGKRIAVGAEYDVSMPGFEGHGMCIDITENSSNGGAD